jgi:hypothetical protein
MHLPVRTGYVRPTSLGSLVQCHSLLQSLIGLNVLPRATHAPSYLKKDGEGHGATRGHRERGVKLRWLSWQDGDKPGLTIWFLPSTSHRSQPFKFNCSPYNEGAHGPPGTG